jgi:hypothetical protein
MHQQKQDGVTATAATAVVEVAVSASNRAWIEVKY